MIDKTKLEIKLALLKKIKKSDLKIKTDAI